MTRTLFVVLMTFLTFSSLSADDPLRQIRRILRLDEEQTQRLRDLLQIRREAVAPLAVAVRELNAKRRTLLKSDDPADYPVLGETVAMIYDLSGQIRALERESQADFEAFLQDDQLRKFRQIRRGARVVQLVPPFKELKLL